MAMDQFHPAVRVWFENTFEAPTQAQSEAWPAIKSGNHALIAAPTGSGKTLAAFLAAIDDLVWQGLKTDLFGRLEDHTQVVYVSPLKALSNDIQKNLQAPLAGIRQQLVNQGLADISIRTMVRTGDTPPGERSRMRRRPPHILVTTPESLFILLTSDSGRSLLSTTRTLIVDEIHALAGNKRGSHLTLSIERLQELCDAPLTRIGLSATQKPIETMARFLTGTSQRACSIIDIGHVRERDLGIEFTQSPLDAVMSTEAWDEVYDRLTQLIDAHRTTLIFVNTRRLAERIAKALTERIGEEHVTSHHGSLAREHRLDAEKRLKTGGLRALVATASLELGIDIGDVDLVCQIGSPRAIGTFLQRVGRSGHAVDAIPRGKLFPTTRDDLVECIALLEAVNRGELDRLVVPEQSLDVLAQQIVAELSCGECEQTALFELVQRAWPYRRLERSRFDAVITMLAEGFSSRRGRRSAWVHRDAVNKRLRPRRGAKLVAILNAGTIPDLFDYDVILQPEGLFIGTLNEDFAFESLPGDIFQLGNTAYRILRTTQGKVYVEDAKGQPPNIPFWFGEVPGRSDELSEAVSRLCARLNNDLQDAELEGVSAQLAEAWDVSPRAVSELMHYLGSAHAALGVLPTRDTIVLERFFDEAGDQHLVIHSPYGSRLNRAWGLALRKRFCRKFNFELQAAALEDSIVLSLGSTHSFPLEDVAHYLKATTVRAVLTQALLDAPMFATHWRWNACVALAVQRNRNGKRLAPQLQRMDAEDLLAVIFPDQLACLENIRGQREIPDHPLVEQTIRDCLHEVMDVTGLEALLERIERGEVRIVVRDLTGPSPLAQEILTARPYAFLDDAPAEERRTRMVQARRFAHPQDAARLGVLDHEAIIRVRAEAWPRIRDADELHEALMLVGGLTPAEIEATSAGDWRRLMDALVHEYRATFMSPIADSGGLWVCAERLPLWLSVFPQASMKPTIEPVDAAEDRARDTAIVELVRGRLEVSGPITQRSLITILRLDRSEIEIALLALENEGFAMRGRFSPGTTEVEWCERGLLARIHRHTVTHLRQTVKPVSPVDFMRFLIHWQGLTQADNASGDRYDLTEGPETLIRVLRQLEGFELAAAAWESEILPARVKDYKPEWLDRLCAAGHIVWARLSPPTTMNKANLHRQVDGRDEAGGGRFGLPRKTPLAGPVPATPIALVSRCSLHDWTQYTGEHLALLSMLAQSVLEHLNSQGASFFDDIVSGTELIPAQAEQALSELAALGLINSDSFAGLRALFGPNKGRHRQESRRKPRVENTRFADAGRWSRIRSAKQNSVNEGEPTEAIAHVLLRRYGVVFRKLLQRETNLPPWRDLLYCYRRMEARGEVRGGRFVEGFSGEQFALPEAVGLLRDVSKQHKSSQLLSISAADPLNLVGILLPGSRIPAVTKNRVVYRDGQATAARLSGKVIPLVEMDSELLWEVHQLLLGGGRGHVSTNRDLLPMKGRFSHRDYPYGH